MVYYRYIGGRLMSTSARLTRQKISTTISPTALSYLERLIEKGEVQNLAEAIDLAIDRLLAFENRERLENDTAAYFANLTEKEAAEERALETALSQSATGIVDVDN
jgi:Arc/MetJ-type ribon-helix-helix transcriptional regulator